MISLTAHRTGAMQSQAKNKKLKMATNKQRKQCPKQPPKQHLEQQPQLAGAARTSLNRMDLNKYWCAVT
jgi:hypothetical protein